MISASFLFIAGALLLLAVSNLLVWEKVTSLPNYRLPTESLYQRVIVVSHNAHDLASKAFMEFVSISGIYLSVCLSVCLSIYHLSMYLFMYLCLCVSMYYLSIIHLPIYIIIISLIVTSSILHLSPPPSPHHHHPLFLSDSLFLSFHSEKVRPPRDINQT
jgi:hypothetical protein